jgi:hypothetical protein
VIGLENLSKPVINRKRLQRVGTEAVSAPIISIIGAAAHVVDPSGKALTLGPL